MALVIVVALRILLCAVLVYGPVFATFVWPASVVVGLSAAVLLTLSVVWVLHSGRVPGLSPAGRARLAYKMWGLGISDLIVVYIAAAALGAVSPTLLLIVQHFEPPLPRSFGQTVVVGLVALAVIGPLWLGLGRRDFPAGGSASAGPAAHRPARERIEGYEAGGQGPDTDVGSGSDADMDIDWD